MQRQLSRSWGLAILVLLSAVSAYAQSTATVTVRPVGTPAARVLLLVDGKIVELESAEIQRGQHVMVALRDLEKLGWGVVESASPDKVTFKGKGISLMFTKGRGTAMVNSLVLQLPIDTYMRDGKLMVPLSFVAKAIGFQYDLTQRPVASVLTTPPAISSPSKDSAGNGESHAEPGRTTKPTEKTTNTLQGTILYDGTGVEGVIVRAVDPGFNVVKTGLIKTDGNGEYKIENLPDGAYMAYVYIGDNPAFLNRASERIEAAGGQTCHAQPIPLMRVVVPSKPKPGGEISLPKGLVVLTWSACEGADRYRLTIVRRGTDKLLADSTVSEPKAEVPASLFTKGSTYEVSIWAENVLGDSIGRTAGSKPWVFSIKK